MKVNKSVVGILIIAMILMLCQCSIEPGIPTTKYSLSQLQDDYNQLSSQILENHPMYFTDRYELGRAFDSGYALIKDSLTIIEFYRIIAPVVSKVKCGHTRLSLPESVEKHLQQYGNYLPFDIKVINDSLFVYKSYVDEPAIEPGCALLSINGDSSAEIIRKIKNSLWTDGNNETFKDYNINNNFRGHYLTNIDAQKKYDLVLSNQISDREMSATVLAKSPGEIRQFMDEHDLHDPSGRLIEKTFFDDDNYALLKVRFFDFYDDLDRFANMMDEFFSHLSHRNIKSLILDMRGNDGGDPYSSAYLLSFLIGKPFRYFGQLSTFLYGDLKDFQPIPDNPFSGDLYVLVDGGCYSTTGHFCSLLKYHSVGTFIGVETGGSYACNGGYKEFALKNTGINLLLPHTTFLADVSGLRRGRGIIPDIIVHTSIHDLVNDDDPALEKAISLIRDSEL
jgi:hypothetical protein